VAEWLGAGLAINRFESQPIWWVQPWACC